MSNIPWLPPLLLVRILIHIVWLTLLDSNCQCHCDDRNAKMHI